MEGKLSPQVAVCLQENLYLPVHPWGEGIILFSLISFCLLLLSLHVACFRHKDSASLGFLSPVSHTQVLVLLQSSHCGCLCPFLESFGSISMPARDEGTVRLSLPHSSLFFFAVLCGLEWFAVPRSSLMLQVFLICPQGLTAAPCVSDLMAQPGSFLPCSRDAGSNVTHSLWF